MFYVKIIPSLTRKSNLKNMLIVLKSLLSDAAKNPKVYAFYNADGDNMYKDCTP